MKFVSISIKNFRNFENIKVDLSNKNVFFGMNDVGKTNFLYALRYVFDKDTRKNMFLNSDFYQKNTDNPIEIVVEIDISDVTDADSQKLRARIKGNITSNNKIVYIMLYAEYDSNELIANPEMFWGGDLDNLSEMKTKSIYFELDYVFNPIYIDAYVDLNTLFRKNSNKLIISQSETDKDTISKIDKKIVDLNETIGLLSGVKKFESRITPEYKKFKNENIEVSVKSEIAIKGLYSNIVPYIKKNGENLLYPTSGEGRKKILVYSIYDLLAEKEDTKKINIFLIEEPENHLHRSMQMAISRVLFGTESYKYLFVTTHSPLILSDMDNVNLIRVFNEGKLDTKGIFYSIPDEYKQKKKMLNRGLSEAIFAKKVLLVEGPSEYVLFTKVLSTMYPDYEVNGCFILAVNGIGFDQYKRILEALNIVTIIKTDNDLRKTNAPTKYSVLGFSRVNKYIKCSDKLPEGTIDIQNDDLVSLKRRLYDYYIQKLDEIRGLDKIFLSHCGLEEDLDEILHDKLDCYLPESKGNPIGYLQASKNYHMVELADKLGYSECQIIYDSYNFACLKELIEG